MNKVKCSLLIQKCHWHVESRACEAGNPEVYGSMISFRFLSGLDTSPCSYAFFTAALRSCGIFTLVFVQYLQTITQINELFAYLLVMI